MSGYSVISEVFIGDPVNFRKDIYACWLTGLSVDEAAVKIKQGTDANLKSYPNLDELIYEDIQDSYRIFDFFKEQLFINSWSIVDFNNEEKQCMCNCYFELDDAIVKEIIATGIGEKKRSIIKTSKSKSKRSIELMDGLKLMLEYIQSCNGKKPLVMALQRRFHISCKLSRSYLSLLFLLLDNKEGDSVRSRPYMEWSLMNDVIWFILSSWTVGVEASTGAVIVSDVLSSTSTEPYSLDLSPELVDSFLSISEAVAKNGKNWQLKPGDAVSVESVSRRIASIMSVFKETKFRVRFLCELISNKLGQLYQNKGMSLQDVLNNLQQCNEYLKKLTPTYASIATSFVQMCFLFLEKYYEKYQSFFVSNTKYF
ncbi:hypothetical protein WA538_001262 [Blastocystis sp. DL]